MLEQKAVELRFREWIGALLFNGILRCDHHEAIAQAMGRAVERDASLLHRLEQCSLCLRRRAIDLVGEEKLAEDRPAVDDEAARLEIELICAHDIAGKQVRRELD